MARCADIVPLNPAWQLCTRRDSAERGKSGGVHNSYTKDDGSIGGGAISGGDLEQSATLTRGRKQDGLGCLGKMHVVLHKHLLLGMDRPTNDGSSPPDIKMVTEYPTKHLLPLDICLTR